MAKWKGIVGKNFTIEKFKEYVEGISWDTWKPQFIVLHNTGVPSLATYPNGLTERYIKVILSDYYRYELGWSAGPHVFVDDHQIWVFTPLTTTGVHSPSWNSRSLGVEMLGNYNIDLFNVGRGAKVRDNAVAAIAILSEALGINPDTMRFHKEDPRTDHDCPGKNVDKEDFIARVKEYLNPPKPESKPEPEPEVIPDKVEIPVVLTHKINWWESFLKYLGLKK